MAVGILRKEGRSVWLNDRNCRIYFVTYSANPSQISAPTPTGAPTLHILPTNPQTQGTDSVTLLLLPPGSGISTAISRGAFRPIATSPRPLHNCFSSYLHYILIRDANDAPFAAVSAFIWNWRAPSRDRNRLWREDNSNRILLASTQPSAVFSGQPSSNCVASFHCMSAVSSALLSST